MQMNKLNIILSFLMVLCCVNLPAQSITVKGSVADEAGEPLPSAIVVAKPSPEGKVRLSVTADVKGQFSIECLPTDVLVVYFLGYEDATVPVKSQTVVNVVMHPSSETLLNETVDGKYKVTPAGQQYLSNKLTSLIKYRGNTLERKKPSVILCHFRDGLTENEREYAIINPDKMEWFGDLSTTLGHNLLVNSSSELLAVFEVSSVTVKDSETPVQVTLFYGDTSKQIEVQNPFELNGARECPVCPVWVSGNRYVYARDVGGKARVELHEICSDGTDREIKSIDVDDYCIPICADESLIILYNTSEKKVKYSTDWEETEYAVGKDIDPWSGVMEYISCENGVYEFANSLHRYTFSSGHFDMIDTNDKPQELRLENGTLKWRYGVVVLKI